MPKDKKINLEIMEKNRPQWVNINTENAIKDEINELSEILSLFANMSKEKANRILGYVKNYVNRMAKDILNK